MNPQATILTRLRSDSALVALLTAMPDDSRANGIYATPLDPASTETAEAFMAYPADIGTDLVYVPFPSIYVNPGRANPHPQANRSGINTLIAFYPQVWVYAPSLPGEDAEGLLRSVQMRVFTVMDNAPYIDVDTGLGGHFIYAGTTGGVSPEFTNTVYEAHRYEATTRWRQED